MLDGGGQHEDPGIDDGQAWDDGEVGHAIAHGRDGLCGAFGPARGRAQCEVEEGEEHKRCEEATGQRRQAGAGHDGRGGSDGERLQAGRQAGRHFGTLSHTLRGGHRVCGCCGTANYMAGGFWGLLGPFGGREGEGINGRAGKL